MATVIALPLPYPSYSDVPLRVLTPTLSPRIRAVNHVRWLCKQQDIQIESQDLLRGARPRLRIALPTPALLRYAECVRERRGITTAVVHGVDVQWSTPERPQ